MQSRNDNFSVPCGGEDKRDPWPIEKLLEGRHYYREGALIVFSERYHLSRGSCCGSSCRHCPFGHANVKRPARTHADHG